MELTGEQRRDYNTVVLAGLLHDIGKFFNRLWKVWMKHPLASVKFIECPVMLNILKKKEMDINIELLKLLVQRHHEAKRYFPEDQLVQKITDPHKRALAYMVARADKFSSLEMDEEEERAFEYYKKYRIHSTFSLIDISSQPKKDKFYQLQEFTPETIFPMDRESLDRETYSYENLEDKMNKELKLFTPENFTELFNGLWYILRKFLWAVPSGTWRKRSDISLFDHLSTTSAIAASLYLYHKDNIDEKEITNDEKEKFLIVGGDLSDIHDFLFETHQRNPKKLSKTLRGRSFLLSLLVEITALKILKALNLPHSAKLMSSGGRFVIMAPNLDKVKETLKKLAVEIEEEFFKTFLGKLTLTLDFQTTVSGQDLKIGRIKEKINQVNVGLIRKKSNKNIHVLKNGKYKEFLKKPHGHAIQTQGICSFCGVFPREEDEKDERCFICRISEALGEEILHSRFLLFTEESNLFQFLGIGIELTDEYKPNLLAYALQEQTAAAHEKNYRGTIFYGIANYLPIDKENLIKETDDDKASLCSFCKSRSQCPIEERKVFQNIHLSFQCIASYTPFTREGKGVDELAVLKADIDDLEYIAQYGFDSMDEPGISKYSVSRSAFLNRMIDAFFQYWLKHFINEKYSMTYIVYARGDDLLLIGPWAYIIEFSYEFYKSFKRFVGDNPDITLSAGISLFSPHSPLFTAVEKAEYYLERSKEKKGKDAVTLFDTTLKWEKLPELFEFADFLDEKINDSSSSINVDFLSRLFKYRRMFIDSEEGMIEGLRFHSLMNYDVRRNIERNKGNEVINPEELAKLRPLYATGEDLNKELLRNLNIPLYIALFKNRGGK